jgi:hypothetical protein
METRGSIRLHYGADPQLRAPDSGLRSTGRGAPEHRFAAWPKSLDGRRACCPRAHRMCRSALRPGWRRPSF